MGGDSNDGIKGIKHWRDILLQRRVAVGLCTSWSWASPPPSYPNVFLALSRVTLSQLIFIQVLIYSSHCEVFVITIVASAEEIESWVSPWIVGNGYHGNSQLAQMVAHRATEEEERQPWFLQNSICECSGMKSSCHSQLLGHYWRRMIEAITELCHLILQTLCMSSSNSGQLCQRLQ